MGAIVIYRQEVRPFTDQADRAFGELRRAGRHRDREHAAAERAARIPAAADRDRRRAQGHQPLDVRLTDRAADTWSNRQPGSAKRIKAPSRSAKAIISIAQSCYGYPPAFLEYVKDVPVEPGRSTGIGRALVEGKVVHIPDVQADPDYTWTEAQQLGGFRTILGVPLLREGVPVGVMGLTRKDGRAHSRTNRSNWFRPSPTKQ